MTALGDEQVGGFDVAMDNSLGMSGVESVCNFNTDFNNALDFQGPTVNEMLERRAIEKFHRDKGAAVLFADVMYRTDIGVVQRGGRAGFPLEAIEGLGIPCNVVREKFQGYESCRRLSSAL